MRLDEAIPNLRKGQRLDPGNSLNFWVEGMAQISLGDLDATEDLITQLQDMSQEHWSVRVLATMKNIYAENYAGAAEAWRQTGSSAPDETGVDNWMLFTIANLEKDYPAARRLLIEIKPEALDPAQWADWIARRPDEACSAGWVLVQSGEEASGQQLLQQAADFMANTAPLHMNRTERLPLGECLAALGDREGALAHIEALASLDYSFFSWFPQRQPMFDELRTEPRFIAAVARLEEKRDEQRANLERMQAGGSL
jgi:tetratricopeptide (TPR) repeat protein